LRLLQGLPNAIRWCEYVAAVGIDHLIVEADWEMPLLQLVVWPVSSCDYS
jgi:hypothetical protein